MNWYVSLLEMFVYAMQILCAIIALQAKDHDQLLAFNRRLYVR